MAEFVTGFQTKEGVKKYDYNALGNKPSPLQTEGSNPDAPMSQKAVTDFVNANVTELANTQQMYVFGGDFSGTTYTPVSCNIPAGSYIVHIDRIESSDTDADTCQINFVSSDAVLKTFVFQRNTSINESLTLSAPVDTIRIYASKAYNEGRDDTFRVSGLKIVSDTILNQRISALEKKGIARIDYIELLANKWTGETSPYSQVVAVKGVTENSQVDLTPDVEQLAVFHRKDLAFVTENEDGVVTVYAIGSKPTNDYTIQATITEVNV
jgi:hypothetical protein